MRKMWFSFLFLLLWFCFALTPRDGEVSPTVSKQSSYNSEAIYQSSHTCAGSTLQAVFVSSPSPASFYGIDVTSANPGASVEVFDGVGSTGNARKMSYINAAVSRFYPFNVSVSSWLGVSNQPAKGGNPACLDILFKTR